MFSMLFWKKKFKYPNTYGSGVGIVDEHDQPGIYISINKIEYPLGK